MATDGCGHTYVGASSGNVKALRLRFTGARNNCCVEHAGTLLLRVSATCFRKVLSECSACDEQHRYKPTDGHPCQQCGAVSITAPLVCSSRCSVMAGTLCVTQPHVVPQMTNSSGGETEQRAHSGPVHAIAACDDRVWTSGGVGAAATLREWSSQGALHNNVELTADGELAAMQPVY